MKEKNYTKNEKGYKKIRDLLNDPKIVMMATALGEIPFSVCPMTIQQMDEEGDLWFFTARDSEHFRNIEADNRVQLIYADMPEHKYISILGNATHVMDSTKANELWNDGLNEWFNGKNDADLALLNVHIRSAYYWDEQANKLIPFLENFLEDRGQKGHIDFQDR